MLKIWKGISGNLNQSKYGRSLQNILFKIKYGNAEKYWEKRYAHDGNSGAGSYGNYASYKADIVNDFIQKQKINSVIDLGCGDGNQLKFLKVPDYIGFDVSKTAIQKCEVIFRGEKSKRFYLYDRETFENKNLSAELVLSLDVIYHLISEREFIKYMQDMFTSSLKFVMIYSWNGTSKQLHHVKHRNFTSWIKENKTDWQIVQHIPNQLPGHFCDFYVYQKVKSEPVN